MFHICVLERRANRGREQTLFWARCHQEVVWGFSRRRQEKLPLTARQNECDCWAIFQSGADRDLNICLVTNNFSVSKQRVTEFNGWHDIDELPLPILMIYNGWLEQSTVALHTIRTVTHTVHTIHNTKCKSTPSHARSHTVPHRYPCGRGKYWTATVTECSERDRVSAEHWETQFISIPETRYPSSSKIRAVLVPPGWSCVVIAEDSVPNTCHFSLTTCGSEVNLNVWVNFQMWRSSFFTHINGRILMTGIYNLVSSLLSPPALEDVAIAVSVSDCDSARSCWYVSHALTFPQRSGRRHWDTDKDLITQISFNLFFMPCMCSTREIYNVSL